mgnify:CR=1 FL=1
MYYILLLLISNGDSFSAKREYIPSGLTKESWEKIKEKERQPKKYGSVGISQGFKSRSLNEFLELKEKGLTNYNMPVFNAKEKLEKGEIKEKDIPYMQRKNGKPDNSDLNFNIIEFLKGCIQSE